MLPPEQRLRRRIADEGPISVADYMAEANEYYYATRDPLGAAGDFTTAPEISQMFGELVGIWAADLWLRAGKPDVRFVELGPGRGTLARDSLRAMRAAGLVPPVDLVETSPTLRRAQADVPGARWHDDLSTLDEEAPLIVVANEYFDCLPIHQYGPDGRELRVGLDGDRFLRDSADTISERSPVALAQAAQIAGRLARQGGGALIIDYGLDPGEAGDTLQAVLRHAYADPWKAPGSRDLTALVDFTALGEAARVGGAKVFGPVGQGRWLEAMGIDVRVATLARAQPDRAQEMVAARQRLTAPAQMGRLFKVMALTAPDWPQPAGLQ